MFRCQHLWLSRHNVEHVSRGCVPGLIEDTEEKELKGLVEERVKALHFRAPQVCPCAALA